jgi:GNAT superfamily N-acetyltransferase
VVSIAFDQTEPMTVQVDHRWCTSSEDLDSDLFEDVVRCWLRVSNDGGAVGFPFLPVEEADVREAAVAMRASLNDDCRLLAAQVEGSLVGWLLLTMNSTPLTRHWATVSRVQTDLPYRGRGFSAAMLSEVERVARADLAVEQLHIEVRGGQGLEEYYSRLGWRVVGRWPAALRLSATDTRDEVLMLKVVDAL